MGRNLHFSREIEGIIDYANRVVRVPFYVSSTFRANAITVSGKRSNHAMGFAVDIIAAHEDGRPKPTENSPELLAIYKPFLRVASSLSELIYCGPGVEKCVKYGKLVNPYACPIHHDHVHIAVFDDIYLPDYLSKPKPAKSGKDVTPREVIERTDMATAITVPRLQGGYAILQTRDGGVFNYNSPFFGSMINVAPGPFVAFTWTLTGKGYWILDAEGAVFAFGDAPYHGGVNTSPLKEHFGNRIPVGLVALPDGTYNIIGQDVITDGTPFDSYHLPVKV